jgi:hypothetical protein
VSVYHLHRLKKCCGRLNLGVIRRIKATRGLASRFGPFDTCHNTIIVFGDKERAELLLVKRADPMPPSARIASEDITVPITPRRSVLEFANVHHLIHLSLFAIVTVG